MKLCAVETYCTVELSCRTFNVSAETGDCIHTGGRGTPGATLSLNAPPSRHTLAVPDHHQHAGPHTVRLQAFGVPLLVLLLTVTVPTS